MHLEDNYNGSYFTKDVVSSAIPSLANIPILGFIRDKGDGSQDFTGHEEELVVKDGDVEIVYKGSAYGVIPENNNAKFETRLCDDGVEREFLTVEGIMWNKFSSAIDILVGGGGIRPHSMEIADNYTGRFRDDGYYQFDSFQFEGACILGVDVEPAMINSTIEVQTDFAKSIASHISDMLKEYKKSTDDKVDNDAVNKLFSELTSIKSTLIADDNINKVFSALNDTLNLLNGGNKYD